MQVDVVQAGRADALIVWWDLHLDRDQQFKLSTAPAWVAQTAAAAARGSEKHLQDASAQLASHAAGPMAAAAGSFDDQAEPHKCRLSELNSGRRQQWRDHWKTCWAPVAGCFAGQHLAPGDTGLIHTTHDDTSILVSVSSPTSLSQPRADHPATEPTNGTCSQGHQADAWQHPAASSECPLGMAEPATGLSKVPQDLFEGADPCRAWVLRQQQHWDSVAEAVERTADGLGPDLPCLVLGDSPQLAFIAARCRQVADVLCILVRAQPGTQCWASYSISAHNHSTGLSCLMHLASISTSLAHKALLQ